MSCVAGRTRNKRNVQLLEMYRERRRLEGSSGSNNGEPTRSDPSQGSNQDKENEAASIYAKESEEVAAGNRSKGKQVSRENNGLFHVEDKDGKGIDEGTGSLSDKMVLSSDDSDEDMSSTDSSGSETNNSDDEDFDIKNVSEEENSCVLIDTDESSSETDEVNEKDVIVIDHGGTDDEAGVEEVIKNVGKNVDDEVIVIDEDTRDDEYESRNENKKHGASNSTHREEEYECRNENKKRGASNSTHRKEEESLGSSKKLKSRSDGIKVVKSGKGPAKTRRYEDDSDYEEGKRDVDARSGKIHKNGAGKEDGEKKARGLKKKRIMDKKSRHVVDVLVDSIVHGSDAVQEATKLGMAPPPLVYSSLPLKFRFKEEDEIEQEKSELDIEADKLFAEWDFVSLYEETGSNMKHELEDEADDEEDSWKEKTNGSAICSEEGHDTYLNEEIGLICLRCNKVLMEMKDIPPTFGKDPKEASERRRYIAGEDSVLDQFDFRGQEDDGKGLSSHSYGTVWSLIPDIRKSMYPHQQEGFEFLWNNMAGTIELDQLKGANPKSGGGCIISHAPGTGKTRLTIIFLQTFLKLYPQCHPVIIAPAGMLLTWEEEFKKWNFDFPFHNLNNPEFSGKESDDGRRLLSTTKCQDKKAARLVKLYSWSKGKSVLGISYSLYDKITGESFVNAQGKRTKSKKKGVKAVLSDQDARIKKILLELPELVVLDEGHTPRNKTSRIWNSVLELKTERRIILSGTPFQNSFDELFNTFELVRPSLAKALGPKLRFADVPASARKYIRKRLRDEEGSQDDKIDRIKEEMSPFVHVHKGSILQDSLPGLRDCVILLNPPELQKKVIRGIQEYQKRLSKQKTLEFGHYQAMVSVHPYLLLKCKEKISLIDEDILEKLRLDYDAGVKTKFTMAIIQLSLNKPDKEKVLVFSQYIDPLDLIRDQLREHLGLGCDKVLQIRGDLDQKSRKGLIDKFNDPDSSAKVMLASTKCCSEGINLVGASRVVLLDVAWNPSVESQAISRAFRLGQKKVVYTYHLMASGTTEVEKYGRQANKDRLSELVFAPAKAEMRWKPAAEIGDVILEKMLENEKLKGMFEKIVHQPKEKNLLECLLNHGQF